MRMIAGFTTATSGRVTVAGHDMATQNEEAARRIGYLPEHPPLYDVLDVSAYLRFVAKVKGVPRAAIPAELDRVTTACRLEAVLRREIYKLSKGYRQRVGLAQALLGNARSPAARRAHRRPRPGPDPGDARGHPRVRADHAVLLSTHILPEVTLICRRVAIINHGRLLAIDSPDRPAARLGTDQPRVAASRPRRAAALREALLSVDGVRARGHSRGRGRATACSPSNARWTPTTAWRPRSRARWPAAGTCTGSSASSPRSRTSSCATSRSARERGGGMNGMLAVYQKELATYFRSPIAYFVVAVFLLGTGYFFLYNIFLTGETTMEGTFQNMGILLLTLIPVISMRLFSGEYSGRTMELLMTLPLQPVADRARQVPGRGHHPAR